MVTWSLPSQNCGSIVLGAQLLRLGCRNDMSRAPGGQTHHDFGWFWIVNSIGTSKDSNAKTLFALFLSFPLKGCKDGNRLSAKCHGCHSCNHHSECSPIKRQALKCTNPKFGETMSNGHIGQMDPCGPMWTLTFQLDSRPPNLCKVILFQENKQRTSCFTADTLPRFWD